MKYLLQLIFIAIIFSNCGSKNSYSFEANLFDCYLEEAKKADVDIKQAVIDAEEFLVTNNLMDNNSAENYLKLRDRMVKNEELTSPVRFPSELFNRFYKITDKTYTCFQNYDKEKAKNSRFEKLIQTQDEKKKSMKKSGDLKIQSLKMSGYNFFTKEDFEQPFYRFKFMQMISIKSIVN